MCKLEVGKYYRTRDGKSVWGPMKQDIAHGGYSFTAQEVGSSDSVPCSFTEDGGFWPDEQDEWDLVEEVPRPLLLEAGKSYRTRDGEFVLGPVLEFCGECGYPFAVKTSAGMVVLREDGRLYAGEDHLYDLVEEAEL